MATDIYIYICIVLLFPGRKHVPSTLCFEGELLNFGVLSYIDKRNPTYENRVPTSKSGSHMHVDIGKRVLHFQLHEYCVFISKQTLEI